MVVSNVRESYPKMALSAGDRRVVALNQVKFQVKDLFHKLLRYINDINENFPNNHFHFFEVLAT